MCRACNFPTTERRGVGLGSLAVTTGSGDVRLGTERQHRHTEIGPDERGQRRGHGGQRVAGKRRTASTAAVHEVAVEDLGGRRDRVDVGGETARRLRFAHRHDVPRFQVTEECRGVTADRRTALGEHVVREAVAGVRQRAVAHRIEHLQHAILTEHDAAALDADPLRRYADPGIPRPQDLGLHVGPVGAGIEAAGDVQPLDDHSAVELRRIFGSTNHDARGVRRGACLAHLPCTIRGQRRVARVGRRGTGQEVLGLGVPHRGQIEDGRSLSGQRR